MCSRGTFNSAEYIACPYLAPSSMGVNLKAMVGKKNTQIGDKKIFWYLTWLTQLLPLSCYPVSHLSHSFPSLFRAMHLATQLHLSASLAASILSGCRTGQWATTEVCGTSKRAAYQLIWEESWFVLFPLLLAAAWCWCSDWCENDGARGQLSFGPFLELSCQLWSISPINGKV